MLCALALETVADVSNVDLVHEGVLRRVAAEVANDPALAVWLLAAVPPAKPGTATWSALREGGARLVVHDPTVLRSPGGTGERLNLMWWVAVALEKSDGTPAALWGLGGREGGHPVPREEVVGIFADAAHRNLAEPAERAVLRARLAMTSLRALLESATAASAHAQYAPILTAVRTRARGYSWCGAPELSTSWAISTKSIVGSTPYSPVTRSRISFEKKLLAASADSQT